MPLFKWKKDQAPEPILSQEQVTEIMELARQTGPRDYFLFSLLGVRGWRIGTIVGCHRKSPPVDLPGILKEDVREDGVIIHAKGGLVRRDRVPETLLLEVQAYAKTLRKGQRLVELGERQALNLCKKYAQRVGVENPEYCYNHLFRHSFGSYWARKTGRDIWKLRDLMGHTDPRSTSRYVYALSLEEQKEILG